MSENQQNNIASMDHAMKDTSDQDVANVEAASNGSSENELIILNEGTASDQPIICPNLQVRPGALVPYNLDSDSGTNDVSADSDSPASPSPYKNECAVNDSEAILGSCATEQGNSIIINTRNRKKKSTSRGKGEEIQKTIAGDIIRGTVNDPNLNMTNYPWRKPACRQQTKIMNKDDCAKHLNEQNDDDSSSTTTLSEYNSAEESDQTLSDTVVKQNAAKQKRDESKELPNIELLTISVEENKCKPIGAVLHVMEQTVVVQAFQGTPPVDTDSILFLERGKRALGKVSDTFGPVHAPFYAVNFDSEESIKKLNVKVEQVVYCAFDPEFTSYVPTEEIIRYKGSDASWINNEEPPLEALEYSDDEHEAAVKRGVIQVGSKRAQSSNPDADEAAASSDQSDSEKRHTKFVRHMNKKNKEYTARMKREDEARSILGRKQLHQKYHQPQMRNAPHKVTGNSLLYGPGCQSGANVVGQAFGSQYYNRPAQTYFKNNLVPPTQWHVYGAPEELSDWDTCIEPIFRRMGKPVDNPLVRSTTNNDPIKSASNNRSCQVTATPESLRESLLKGFGDQYSASCEDIYRDVDFGSPRIPPTNPDNSSTYSLSRFMVTPSDSGMDSDEIIGNDRNNDVSQSRSVWNVDVSQARSAWNNDVSQPCSAWEPRSAFTPRAGRGRASALKAISTPIPTRGIVPSGRGRGIVPVTCPIVIASHQSHQQSSSEISGIGSTNAQGFYFGIPTNSNNRGRMTDFPQSTTNSQSSYFNWSNSVNFNISNPPPPPTVPVTFVDTSVPPPPTNPGMTNRGRPRSRRRRQHQQQ